MEDKIIDQSKFLTYYYVVVGWACDSKTTQKVTDLTEDQISFFCRNWDTLYRKYILESEENNDKNIEVSASITTADVFIQLMDDPDVFYGRIQGK